MANILDVNDIVNSIKKIEAQCSEHEHLVEPKPSRDLIVNYERFYERVKGLMSLVEENLNSKKGGGPILG